MKKLKLVKTVPVKENSGISIYFQTRLQCDDNYFFYDNPPADVKKFWSSKDPFIWSERAFGGKSFLVAKRKKGETNSD